MSAKIPKPEARAAARRPRKDDADAVREFAAALIDAHRTHRTIEPSLRPRSAEDAYRVQDIVARALWTSAGDAITAWKTGAPNRATTPIAAPIPRSKVLASGAALPFDDFNVIAIEAELAFTIGRDLPPRSTPYGRSDLRAAIASIHPAIEVCDSRLRDWKNADPLPKLADNQMNGALVVGEGVADWQRVMPREQRATVDIGGRRIAEAIGSHPCGDPVVLLDWLANHCAVRCGGLRAGDVVTTGAWTGMHVIAAPAECVVGFPGIGEARASFR
jgi:2-keto-4-pentenoate hydratase